MGHLLELDISASPFTIQCASENSHILKWYCLVERAQCANVASVLVYCTKLEHEQSVLSYDDFPYIKQVRWTQHIYRQLTVYENRPIGERTVVMNIVCGHRAGAKEILRTWMKLPIALFSWNNAYGISGHSRHRLHAEPTVNISYSYEAS